MKPSPSHFLCVLGLVLTACGDPGRAAGGSLNEASEPRSGSPSTELSEACWAVGVLNTSGTTCPDLEGPGWSRHGSQMFVDGSAGLDDLGLTSSDFPPAVGQFCLYQWTGQGAPGPFGEISAPLAEVSLDCPVAAPLGTVNTGYLKAAEHGLFRARIEAPSDDPSLEGAPVVLGLVDGATSLPSSSSQMAHPDALSDIITDAVCPSSGCGVEVLPTLGLPLDETGVLLDPDGGTYGTRAHVALGIMEAVARWKERVATGAAATRLVINLSLGWAAPTSSAGCGFSEAEPWCATPNHVDTFQSFLAAPANDFPTRVAIESVHAALLYATCSGAMVVASAGNTKGDSCNEDPVAPAAWGQFASPTAGECIALGFNDVATPWTADFTVARPLLHPVSAIEVDGDPIALTRPGSETRLVAAGSHATAGTETALTGTSVSAAVVSSAFALLWSQNPSTPPGTIAKQVVDGARPLPRVSELAEFGAPASTPMRNVSLCGALTEQAIAAGTSVPPACLPLPSLGTAMGVMDAAVDDALVNFAPAYEVDASEVALATDVCLACGAPIDVWLPDLETDASHYLFDSCAESPASFVPDEGPSIAGPQPDVPVCPDCPLIATPTHYVALLSIDNTYRSGVTFEGASLILQVGSSVRSYDLAALLGDIDDLQDETRVKISIPSLGSVPRKATLEAKMTDDKTEKTFSRSSALLVSDKT